VARVHFTPSADVLPWTPVARMGFEVDRFNTGAYAGLEGVLAGDPDAVITYAVDCSKPTAGVLGLGPHKIYAWFWVGDQRFPTPSTASFELSCAAPADAGADALFICDGGPHGPGAPDGGAADAELPVPPTTPQTTPTSPDAGPTPMVPTPMTPAGRAPEAGGCSLAPSGGSGGAAALLLALLALVVRRRR
jgi:MYXO-CTERM domain-containing protein